MTRFLFLLLLLPAICFGQLSKKKMSRAVTNSLDNERHPYVSANGKAMLYMALDPFKNVWNLYYARKVGGQWKRAEEVLVINKNPKLLYKGGYCLSPDGNTIYFTTKKYNGVGGYDIFYTKRYGANEWNPPASLGMPVNSSMDDINPSMSSDGDFLYFSRCTKASEGQTECCNIMRSERLASGENFNEPEDLPAVINQGCESSPRILPDDETLVFSSNRTGGKGKHDLYFVQKDHYGKWGQPKNMDFINTAEDDRFLSVDVYTHFFYTDLKEGESTDLFKVKFPKGFEPRNVIAMEGKISDKAGNPIKARVQVYDAETKERVHLVSPEKDGSYWFLLTEGHLYDVSFQALEGNQTFKSELLDLKEVSKFRREKRNVNIEPLAKGKTVNLAALQFDDNSAYKSVSIPELDRVRKYLRESSSRKLEILLFKSDYREDSIKSSGLTEVRYDTVMVKKLVEEVVQIEKDTGAGVFMVDSITTKEVEEEVVKATYHNDTRGKKIRSLKTYFKDNGFEGRVSYKWVVATDPKVVTYVKGRKEGAVLLIK